MFLMMILVSTLMCATLCFHAPHEEHVAAPRCHFHDAFCSSLDAAEAWVDSGQSCAARLALSLEGAWMAWVRAFDGMGRPPVCFEVTDDKQGLK